jgi:hypothetical protein
LRGVATVCCAASDVPCQTGHLWHEQSGVRPTNSPFGPVRLDARFACQAIAGAALPISEVPSLAITAEYRHMAALEQSIPNIFTTFNRSNITPQNHSVFLGIRYAFGAGPGASDR